MARRIVEHEPFGSDENALTAVIEFVSAFVLFLIVVTAFFSLAGLQLGSNHPNADRMDEYALDSLFRLTGDSGWFVPEDSNGDRDIANSTGDWYLLNASQLLSGNLQVGLAGVQGQLDQARVSALNNVTQDQFIRGLSLPDWASANLTITVTESADQNRVDLILFQDGANRRSSTFSSTATRLMVLNDETLQITLEVHNSGRTPTTLRVTEFMAEPTTGDPEWVELHNTGGFAANLTGWGLGRDSDGGLHSLIGDGALAGGEVLLCSGRPSSQENLGAEIVLDLGAAGILGRGTIDGLEFSEDGISLTWTAPGTAFTVTQQHFHWDNTWDIDEDEAYDWNGGDPTQASGWDVVTGGTPGQL